MLYAKAMYLHKGGDPRLIDELPWRVVDAWLSLAGVFDQRQALGGIVDD